MRRHIFVLASGIALASCGQGSPTWTLYRDSVFSVDARIHIGTFDADDTGGGTHTFNEVNCKDAAKSMTDLEAGRAGGDARVRYWCEEGDYHS